MMSDHAKHDLGATADAALAGLGDITRALMSADIEDTRTFREALSATNMLREYFTALGRLSTLAAVVPEETL
jgi:pyridoxal/pyridoxine/pyridoxamine kinase